jgi:hypothetical protein
MNVVPVLSLYYCRLQGAQVEFESEEVEPHYSISIIRQTRTTCTVILENSEGSLLHFTSANERVVNFCKVYCFFSVTVNSGYVAHCLMHQCAVKVKVFNRLKPEKLRSASQLVTGGLR